MNTTIVHPTPISSRFAPVMFARASEHGDSSPPPSGRARRVAGRLVGLTALPREHEVHRVLGQHRDQREHRDRETGRDVELGGLGRPRQQERGAHDGEAVDQGLDRVGEFGVHQPQVDGRQGDGHRGGDADHLAGRMRGMQLFGECRQRRSGRETGPGSAEPITGVVPNRRAPMSGGGAR